MFVSDVSSGFKSVVGARAIRSRNVAIDSTYMNDSK